MRVTGRATSVSWIPSESVAGWLRSGFDLGLAHYDRPPADRIPDLGELGRLRDDDRFRFANAVSGWAEFEDDGSVSGGFDDDSGLLMGGTTVRLGTASMTFLGYALPVLRAEPEIAPDRVALTQTVGGRTGVPLPRRVKHPPFVRWQAPIVWTTLTLTLFRHGAPEVALTGASAFPRHWVYDHTGALVLKSAVTRQQEWMDHSFGPRTPWGDQDSEALAVQAESAVERTLSQRIMAGEGRAPEVRRLEQGKVLVRQGEPGEEVFLVLDGVLRVLVDGDCVAEVGPGAVVGERAALEGGRRSSSVEALTPVRLAVVPAGALDEDHLREVAAGHRREDGPGHGAAEPPPP